MAGVKNSARNPEDRFAKYADIKGDNECWEWRGARSTRGYGKAWHEGKVISAHRLSYILHRGAINVGMHICHTCDNRLCVNPAHLFEGTNQVNVNDKVAKGRQHMGNDHYNAKLSANDIVRIRESRLFGAAELDIASVYGIQRTNVNLIVRRKAWSHVE